MNQTENNRPLVDGVPALERKLEEVRRAQEQFATFSQEQVDRIFQAAALAANHARLPLAKMAVEETGTTAMSIMLSDTAERVPVSPAIAAMTLLVRVTDTFGLEPSRKPPSLSRMA